MKLFKRKKRAVAPKHVSTRELIDNMVARARRDLLERQHDPLCRELLADLELDVARKQHARRVG